MSETTAFMDGNENQILTLKEGNSEIIPPIVVANSTIVLVLSYQWNSDFLVSVVLTAIAFILNVTFVKLNPTVSWLRNDVTDAARWCFNLIIMDIPIIIYLNTTVEFVMAFWLVLTIGAFLEIYSKKVRYMVTLLSLSCGVFTICYLFPDKSISTALIYIVSTVSVLAFVFAIEMNWMKESSLRFDTQRRELELQNQAEGLFKESLTGENAKIIAHEVNNMITAINFATYNPEDIKVDNIKLSLQYVQQACELIMKETVTKIRVFELNDLLVDIKMLIRKQVESQGIRWDVECSDDLLNVKIEEREGSCYFIIQNMVRNAVAAIQSNGVTHENRVLLKVLKGDSTISMEILDTGKGMTDDIKEKLLAGKGGDIEDKNHGIGMKFVLKECIENNFEIFIGDAELPFKTSVGINIPIDFESA